MTLTRVPVPSFCQVNSLPTLTCVCIYVCLCVCLCVCVCVIAVILENPEVEVVDSCLANMKDLNLIFQIALLKV